jgi:hypothetical protein
MEPKQIKALPEMHLSVHSAKIKSTLTIKQYKERSERSSFTTCQQPAVLNCVGAPSSPDF